MARVTLVDEGYLYPYPAKPVPVLKGMGSRGYELGVLGVGGYCIARFVVDTYSTYIQPPSRLHIPFDLADIFASLQIMREDVAGIEEEARQRAATTHFVSEFV